MKNREASNEQRKVLFLMTDSQRADMLGCYGNPDMHTPNLDRLAEQGTRLIRRIPHSSVPAGQGGYLFRLLSSFLRVMV